MKEATLGELVEYVIKHGKNRVFRDCLEADIAHDILEAAKDGTLLYVHNAENKLIGMVVASKNVEQRIMYVRDILTTEKGALKQILSRFKKDWPGYTLEAHRCFGPKKNSVRLIKYNTKRLIKLVTQEP